MNWPRLYLVVYECCRAVEYNPPQRRASYYIGTFVSARQKTQSKYNLVFPIGGEKPAGESHG